jgi:diguanylate cyclase (GGDEF)-like protein
MSHSLQILAIALGACLVAVVVGVVAWLVTRRSAARSAEQRVTAVVSELTSRVDELAGDLQKALDRAESEGRRGRFLGELNASIDLDEVLDRISKNTSSVEGIDAVVVSLDDPGGGRIVSASGMTLEQAQEQVFSSPPDTEAHSMAISYRYGDEADGQIKSALVLPLHGESGRLGYLAAYSRSRERNRDFAQDVGAELEELARRAGPALDNALRFREARRMADLDALTGLHNRRYFHEILAREVARAHRYDRRLSIVLIDLDDFKAINERIGHLAGDSVLAEAAERMLSVVRGSDVPCRVGGDEFAVVLPESGLSQADQLYRRIQGAVSGKPIGHVARLDLSAGVAELTPADDANALFERADEALYRAKDAGKARAFPAVVPEPGVPEHPEPEANASGA